MLPLFTALELFELSSFYPHHEIKLMVAHVILCEAYVSVFWVLGNFNLMIKMRQGMRFFSCRSLQDFNLNFTEVWLGALIRTVGMRIIIMEVSSLGSTCITSPIVDSVVACNSIACMVAASTASICSTCKVS